MGQQQHFSLHKKAKVLAEFSASVFVVFNCLRVCVLVCVCSRTLPCWWGGCCCCGCDCGSDCRAMAPCNAAVQLSTLWLPRVAAAAATSARLLRRTLSRQRTHTQTGTHIHAHSVRTLANAHCQRSGSTALSTQQQQQPRALAPFLLRLSCSLLPSALAVSLSLCFLLLFSCLSLSLCIPLSLAVLLWHQFLSSALCLAVLCFALLSAWIT